MWYSTPMEIMRGKKKLDLIIAAATKGEMPGFASLLPDAFPRLETVRRRGLKIGLLVTGPGPVNAALAAGAAFSAVTASALILTGIGGAYPGSGLKPGCIALADLETDVDTGVEPPITGALPLPMAVTVKEGPHGLYPVDPGLTALLEKAAARSGIKTLKGPFVTSATVTATAVRAATLEKHHRAICENMEGAAVARACQLTGTAFAELRGISNMAGTRDVKTWKIVEAAQAAWKILDLLLEEPGDLKHP